VLRCYLDRTNGPDGPPIWGNGLSKDNVSNWRNIVNSLCRTDCELSKTKNVGLADL
jgi:hypothetical protein